MASLIFTSPPAVKALVTLILIENSHVIRPFWNDLRLHYLPTLLGTMRVANPVIPIPVLWLTTAPVGDDPASLHAPPPRQYNQLPEIQFSLSPDNKISSRIINRAMELMLEAATRFQGGPVNFHLFVVAASSPLQSTWGIPPQVGQSEWRVLGQRFAQLGIHCHMILPASQGMSAMNELFSTSRQLQGHTHVSPWFQTTSEYTFLLSGDPTTTNRDTPIIDAIESPQEQSFPVSRPPVLRHQSFPQDVQSAPPQNGATPSLVSSLQKFHGLSRKKLYGAQPPRQPFVREEPVRAKYKSTPTPLSIPVGSQPFEDGRVLAKTKVERGRRADRHVGDASDSCSPGRRSPWNHVDVASSPSSPTASATSPTIPLYPELTYPTTPSAPFSPGLSIPDTTFSDPYFSSPVISQATWTLSKPKSAKRHSQELGHMPSLTAISTKYKLDGEPRKKVKDAGDVPFIFSPELEAATAAKLHAALQSTSPVSSPSSSFAGFTSNYESEEAYAYEAMQDACPTGLVNGNVHCSDGEPRRFVGSTSSSSLQGWAG